MTNYPHNFQPMATQPGSSLHLQGQLYCTKCGTTILASGVGCGPVGCEFPDPAPFAYDALSAAAAAAKLERDSAVARAVDLANYLREARAQLANMHAAFVTGDTNGYCWACIHTNKSATEPPCNDCEDGDRFARRAGDTPKVV